MKGTSKVKGLYLLLPYLLGRFIQLDPGLFVSLILPLEVLYLRFKALKVKKAPYELEVDYFYFLLAGVLLGLIVGGAEPGYYWAFGLCLVLSHLPRKKYRLPLYLLLESGAFQALYVSGGEALPIFSAFYYGILMIFSALGLIERRRLGD